MPTLKIGTFTLPVLAGLDIDQSYELIGGEAVFRTLAGTGLKQATWKKLKTTIGGSGWVPAGLEAIDTNSQQVVSCVVPRRVPAVFATRQATLPAARRSDAGHLPYGLATLADGQMVQAAATLAGDVATVAAVAGAVDYAVGYFPQITAWVQRPATGGAPNEASHRWEIVAEEV